jgi:hypothetical protein
MNYSVLVQEQTGSNVPLQSLHTQPLSLHEKHYQGSFVFDVTILSGFRIMGCKAPCDYDLNDSEKRFVSRVCLIDCVCELSLNQVGWPRNFWVGHTTPLQQATVTRAPPFTNPFHACPFTFSSLAYPRTTPPPAIADHPSRTAAMPPPKKEKKTKSQGIFASMFSSGPKTPRGKPGKLYLPGVRMLSRHVPRTAARV